MIPVSLLLLGLLQGSSYLWVIGNDFTRYWAIADALGATTGYPATLHQPVYRNAGMYLYSIELPGFPLLLLLSFSLFGHDTVGAHVPALLANIALPLLLYGLYTRGGLGRPLAFAASCAVVVLPPFRLYTLNAPVPDTVFVALLVGAAYLFLGLARRPTMGTEERPRSGGPAATAWLLFGLLAGLTALTRPEGLLFAGMMFVGLAPNLLRPRFYLSVLSFLAAVTPFSLLMLNSFGLLWPRNFGTSASVSNVDSNLRWLEKYSVRWYAEPLDLSASGFALLVGLLTLAALAGTLWLAAHRWQVALLPLAAALHIGFVFTIDPRVSGADQWFDFFRHISYGIPFLALSILFLADRCLRRIRFRVGPAHVLAVLVLLVATYELRTLAFPSRSYGSLGRQLLTSDVWVSMHDIVANRYALPTLTFVQREGVLVPDFESRYMLRHARSVISHFEPVSCLSTGRGAGYQLSSLLVVLFGAVFVFAGSGGDRPRRSNSPGPDGLEGDRARP